LAFFGFPTSSEEEVWVFRAMNDERTCEVCADYNNNEFVVETANESREEILGREFPDLLVVDDDMMLPRLHVNCRCFLERVPNR